MADDPAPGAPPPLLRDPNASTGPLFEFNRPTVIVLLYLATYFTGLSAVVGVILAYVWRAEATEWEASHLTWLIRTFWLGLAAMIIGLLAMLVGLAASSGGGVLGVDPLAGILLAVLIVPAGLIWLLARCVRCLIRAQQRQPMPRPHSWLV